MMAGKSIRLFLVDGTSHGLLSAEIINWTGRVLVAARSDLDKLARRPEARRPGVYILLGNDPNKLTKERAYIGESEDVFGRLMQHDGNGDKEFWTRTALVLSKDENLTKSHIRYLESRLIREAKAAGRVILDNGTEPEACLLPEADQADMEYFLSQVRILLPVLGFNLLQVLVQGDQGEGESDAAESSPLFEMTPVGVHAEMRIVGDEFVVLKGSTARKEGVSSWDTYRSLRDQLVTDKRLIDSNDPKYYVFAEDVPFTSPSAAASVVNAGNQNGRLVWRVKGTGQTYGDWQKSFFDEGDSALKEP